MAEAKVGIEGIASYLHGKAEASANIVMSIISECLKNMKQCSNEIEKRDARIKELEEKLKKYEGE